MENASTNKPAAPATKPTVEELTARVEALELKVAELADPPKKARKEMTDEHARRVLTGDLAKLDHNKAADELDLSYGQIYSCRGEYTFRHIHAEIKKADPSWKNPWKKS